MITKTSIPIWPKNVSLGKQHINDLDLKINYPINTTSYVLLNEVNGRRTIQEISNTVSKKYNWDAEMVEIDFCILTTELNKQYLMNVKYKNPLKNNIINMIIFILLMTKTINPNTWGVSKRFHINRKGSKVFFQITRIIVLSYFWIIFYLTLLLSFIMLYINSFEWLTLFIIVASIIFGMVVHEFAHYIVFIYFDRGKHNTFFVNKMGQTKFIRPPMNYKEDILITIAGPMLPFLLSIICLPIIGILEWIEINVAITWWGAVLCLCMHIMFLFPPFQDGRRIVSLLFSHKRGQKNEKG